MKYLNVSKFERIKSCKIFDEAYSRDLGFNVFFDAWLQHYDEPYELKFENGIAIARVFVDGWDFFNNDQQYVTYAIIKEVKDKDTDEVKDYELVDMDDEYFRLPQFIEGIERKGNHFFFAIRTSRNDEGTATYTAYWQYDYDPKTGKFVKIGKLEGVPTITKNDDLVIISGSKLFSLSKQEYVSDKYSSIQDIDGETFFVADTIVSRETENGRMRNHLMFDIDKNGKKITKVYSRNDGEPTNDEISVPYEEILEREIAKLNDLVSKENTFKLLLKVNEDE